jgi:CTP:phosphocholine cytidylyltransferase-like protein
MKVLPYIYFQDILSDRTIMSKCNYINRSMFEDNLVTSADISLYRDDQIYPYVIDRIRKASEYSDISIKDQKILLFPHWIGN